MAGTDFTGAAWRKSSRSTNAPNCVEVAHADRVVGVRDSKSPAPTLAFTPTAWGTFLDELRSR